MPRGIYKRKKDNKTSEVKEEKKEKSFVPPFTEGEDVPHGTEEKKVKTALEVKKEAEKDCINCAHPANMHYGNTDRWCNERNCRCGSYRQ